MYFLSLDVTTILTKKCTRLSRFMCYILKMKNVRKLVNFGIYRRREEVTVHSRIYSIHFLSGRSNKKNNKDTPQIFPWPKYASTPTPFNQVVNR